MMDDFTKGLIVAMICVTLIISGAFAYNARENFLRADVISKAANPIAAACALGAFGNSSEGQRLICMELVKGQK